MSRMALKMKHAMPSSNPSLETLRDEIDRIDTDIHRLLIERTGIVERIRDAKAAQSLASGAEPAPSAAVSAPAAPIRPAREAMIIRRLAERHNGSFPLPELIRIWREMLAGSTRIQGPFAVAACVTDGNHALWDIARDHFGSATPIRSVKWPMAAVRAVMDREATVGVVPWPEDDDPAPWWNALMSSDPKTPRIVARLPFTVTKPENGTLRALAVASIPHEPTGDDRTFLALEPSEDISRSRLRQAATHHGLELLSFWSAGTPGRDPGTQLMEVSGFIAQDDQRMQAFRAALGQSLHRVQVLGGYAVPITLP